MTVAAHAYTPPPLRPLQMRFLNLLLTRNWSHEFDLHGTPCSVDVDPWQVPFAAACGFTLKTRGEVWQVLFSSFSPMGLHPAGSQIANIPNLPEGLRLALFELSLAPVFALLADGFGPDYPPTILAETCDLFPHAVCFVPMVLRLPTEKVALSLAIPSLKTAEAILFHLEQMPPKRNPVPVLPLVVAMETGSMRLSLAELSALQPEDILLPEAWFQNQGELNLRFTPTLAVRCAVDSGRATVIGIERRLPRSMENETRRKEMADTPPNAASDNTIPKELRRESESLICLDAVEITVTFELERRLMNIAEIAAMTPGYTFSLLTDSTGPVAIRANGHCLGKGRLVDLDGVLGVQVISLEQEK